MAKKRKGGRKCHCPKTRGGKKVRSSKGRCWTKSPVKKVCGKKGRKGRKGCPKGRVKRGPRKGRCRK